MNIRLATLQRILVCCVNRSRLVTAHVEWWDNFSKTYACNAHRLATGAYQDCQWTGRAMHDIAVPHDTLLLSSLGDTPAMTSDLFHPMIENAFMTRLRKTESMDSAWRERSMCTRFNVCTVPPKPELTVTQDSEIWTRMQAGRDGLDFFHPVTMEPVNCGSNDGLLALVRQMHERELRKPLENRFLQVVVTDLNLFKRFIKVATTHLLEKHTTLAFRCHKISPASATAPSTSTSPHCWALGIHSNTRQSLYGVWLNGISWVPCSMTCFRRLNSVLQIRTPHV